MRGRAPLARLGGIAWILGTAQFFVLHLIVQSAWTTPYSWKYNNISDLGNVGCGPWGDDGRYVCSPLHAWMNASFILQGVLILVGLGLARSLWQRGFVASITRALIFLAGLGWIVAGLAPADVNENLHVVLGASVIFFGGNLGLAFTGLTLRSGATRPLGAAALLLGTGGLFAVGLFARQRYLGLGMGGMERCIVFPLQFWLLLVGISRVRATERVQPHAAPLADRVGL